MQVPPVELGTSTVPSPTRRSSERPSTPSSGSPLSSSDSLVSATTVFSGTQILPHITATPSPSCTTPNAVIVELSTTLLIPDYDRFFHTPVESFRPTYHALDDGSLVTSPFIDDIKSADSGLAVLAALSMFFLVNTITSASYVQRGKVKKKGLFYVLLISQLFGLAGQLPSLASFFNQYASCTATGAFGKIALVVSYSLLITGILGTKAYRCLSDSRFVLVVLALLRSAMIALTIIDVKRYSGVRRLSGSCTDGAPSIIIPYMIIAQFLETFFICSCFLYAVWKSSRTPVDHGRLSIHPSIEEEEEAPVAESKDVLSSEGGQGRRGWWDYVPDADQSQPQEAQRSTVTALYPSHCSGEVAYLRSIFHKLGNMRLNGAQVSDVATQRKPAVRAERTASQPPRTSSVIFAGIDGTPQRTPSGRVADAARLRARTLSPRPASVMSRLSKYMPRMLLFREVVKNELLYTTFITILFLIVAIVMLVGTKQSVLFGADSWIQLNWVVVSFFTLHSFSRVVRRHEREAILQHPSAWDPMYRAELEASRALRGRVSPVSAASRRPHWRDRSSRGDPFEDFRTISSAHTSPAADSHTHTQDSPHSSTAYLAARAWQQAESSRDPSRAPSVSTQMSLYESNSSSGSPTVESMPRPYRIDSVTVLPSPMSGEYSSTYTNSCAQSPAALDSRRTHATTPEGTSASRRHGDSSGRPSFESPTDWEPPDLENRP